MSRRRYAWVLDRSRESDCAGTGMSRPILRYHGGKWRLAPWIMSFFPKHRIYVEPFGGAGSVLLQKSRSYMDVYNDLDGEIVNLFMVARDLGENLVSAIELTPYSREEFTMAYEVTADPVERARRLVVRSFMGHGSNSNHRISGFRRHSRQSGTSPCHDWRNYPPALIEIIERLQGVVIENRAALDVISEQDCLDTLFYLDPPYVFATRDKGTDYNFEMNDEQHREFARDLRDLKGMVVLSGYPCDLYDVELFSDWQRFERKAMADGALERTEVVWVNHACAKALEEQNSQQRMFA